MEHFSKSFYVLIPKRPFASNKYENLTAHSFIKINIVTLYLEIMQ